jgi:transcriptional regulator with XRE-family HTH domain
MVIIKIEGDIMQIGNNIRQIRELKNLKQEYIALRLNLSLTSYGKIERNEVDISISRLNEISKILEISVAVLIDFNFQQILETNSSKTNENSVYHLLIQYMEENIRLLNAENIKLLGLIEKLVTTEK